MFFLINTHRWKKIRNRFDGIRNLSIFVALIVYLGKTMCMKKIIACAVMVMCQVLSFAQQEEIQ